MTQIKKEDVVGLVRNEVKKGDQNREKPYTALVRVGVDEKTGKDILHRRQLDSSEARSLEKRLAKDRSRDEREGRREKEREPERREKIPVADRQAREEFMRQFKKQDR